MDMIRLVADCHSRPAPWCEVGSRVAQFRVPGIPFEWLGVHLYWPKFIGGVTNSVTIFTGRRDGERTTDKHTHYLIERARQSQTRGRRGHLI
jgi:hypothetical protein